MTSGVPLSAVMLLVSTGLAWFAVARGAPLWLSPLLRGIGWLGAVLAETFVLTNNISANEACWESFVSLLILAVLPASPRRAWASADENGPLRWQQSGLGLADLWWSGAAVALLLIQAHDPWALALAFEVAGWWLMLVLFRSPREMKSPSADVATSLSETNKISPAEYSSSPSALASHLLGSVFFWFGLLLSLSTPLPASSLQTPLFSASLSPITAAEVLSAVCLTAAFCLRLGLVPWHQPATDLFAGRDWARNWLAIWLSQVMTVVCLAKLIGFFPQWSGNLWITVLAVPVSLTAVLAPLSILNQHRWSRIAFAFWQFQSVLLMLALLPLLTTKPPLTAETVAVLPPTLAPFVGILLLGCFLTILGQLLARLWTSGQASPIYLDDFAGQGTQQPVASWGLVVLLASLAGLPLGLGGAALQMLWRHLAQPASVDGSIVWQPHSLLLMTILATAVGMCCLLVSLLRFTQTAFQEIPRTFPLSPPSRGLRALVIGWTALLIGGGFAVNGLEELLRSQILAVSPRSKTLPRKALPVRREGPQEDVAPQRHRQARQADLWEPLVSSVTGHSSSTEGDSRTKQRAEQANKKIRDDGSHVTGE